MRAFLVFGVASSLVAGAAAIASCGGGSCDGKFNCAQQDGAADVTTIDVTDGSPVSFQETGADGGNCAVTCSGDLHDVIDCHGNVVTACPPDEGCAAGACVAACTAASANKSSVGCDYYVVPATDFVGETCLGVYVANTWGAPVTLTVGLGATDYTTTLSSYG